MDSIGEQPREFLYRDVKLEATVDRTFGECSFEVADDTTGFFDQPLLVLCSAIPPVAQGGFVPPRIEAGDRLLLAGSVREMTRLDYERKTTVTLSEDVFGPRATRAVLWADTFDLLPRDTSEER